jgi:hypothetical protein
MTVLMAFYRDLSYSELSVSGSFIFLKSLLIRFFI